MNDVATKCIADLAAKVANVPLVGKNIHHIYSEEDIVSVTKGMSYPCVGLLYDGMRASPETGATKQGQSVEVVCSALLFYKASSPISSKDEVGNALIVMDNIRDAIKCTRSPTGNFWRFQMEAALGGKNSILMYVQRWATPTTLT